MALALLAESILHTLIAAAFVEALLRRWAIRDAAWRLRLRSLALAIGTLGPLLFLPFAAWRGSGWFAANLAVFAGERWNQISPAGLGMGDLALLIAAAAGSAIFLRDALPPLRDALRPRDPLPDVAPWHPARVRLQPVVSRAATALKVPAPEIRVVDVPVPILLCEGAREPIVIVSPAAIGRLRGDALPAAVAHELAHAAHRDPAWGYGLVAVRAAYFFNPAVQWLARAMVDDIEERADRSAVRATGLSSGMVAAIRAMFEADHPPPAEDEASFERVFWRIRRQGVERRVARLAGAEPDGPLAHGPVLLGAAAASLLILLFFVV